jgi:hypothetical protein
MPSEEVTEIQPTAEPRHRGWRNMFRGSGGGHRLAHR